MAKKKKDEDQEPRETQVTQEVKASLARSAAIQEEVAKVRDVDTSDVLARKLNQDFIEKRDKGKAEEKARDEATRIYYYKCKRCSEPACYFTENPVSILITPDKWWAEYRKVTDPWYQPYILCQACHNRGRTTHIVIKIDPFGGGFRIDGRYAKHIHFIRVKEDDPLLENTGAEPVPQGS